MQIKVQQDNSVYKYDFDAMKMVCLHNSIDIIMGVAICANQDCDSRLI